MASNVLMFANHASKFLKTDALGITSNGVRKFFFSRRYDQPTHIVSNGKFDHRHNIYKSSHTPMPDETRQFIQHWQEFYNLTTINGLFVKIHKRNDTIMRCYIVLDTDTFDAMLIVTATDICTTTHTELYQWDSYRKR